MYEEEDNIPAIVRQHLEATRLKYQKAALCKQSKVTSYFATAATISSTTSGSSRLS